MPNHFHFLIRIRSEKELKTSFPDYINSGTLEKFISKQFSNFFSSYAQAFNKQNSRKGSLFIKNFKRKKINSENYLRKLVHYIHFNPVSAGLCAKPDQWKYSSYTGIIGNKPTLLLREEVLSWFQDSVNFLHVHKTSLKSSEMELDEIF
jgi:putative transposase